MALIFVCVIAGLIRELHITIPSWFSSEQTQLQKLLRQLEPKLNHPRPAPLTHIPPHPPGKKNRKTPSKSSAFPRKIFLTFIYPIEDTLIKRCENGRSKSDVIL